MLVTIFTIVHLIICVGLIAIVVMQSGKKSGMSAISGGSESYLSKNKSGALDAKLARSTKWVAIAFAVMTIALNIAI